MIPKSISASSLQVLELCPDRWVAEYYHKGGQASGIAADTGTAVHGALEEFVDAVYIKKTHAGLDKAKRKELLLMYYQMSYCKTFNTTDMDTLHFTDGRDLCMKWFTRTELSDRTVLSVEQKESIPIPFNYPGDPGHTCEHCLALPPGQCSVPFNYIMDRLDQTGEDEYEVVDYKTVRVPIQPDDLEAKIQARAYSLAVQIKFPNAKKIKVTFDLLRHEQVSLWFTRDDNIRFWRFLCSELQRIVDMREEDAKPVINPDCAWCIKRSTCKLVQSNINVGGIQSLSIDERVALTEKIKNIAKVHKYLLEELEESIMRHAAETEHLSWETEDGAYEVEITSQRRRQFDPTQAAAIMGPELFAQMGNMTLTNLEKIIKDESLDKEMRDQLSELIGYTTGGLGVKVKPKKKII